MDRQGPGRRRRPGANRPGIRAGAQDRHRHASAGRRPGPGGCQHQDPEAKARRGEILLEMADRCSSVKQYKEAAALQPAPNEKLLPEREEEITQRAGDSALHLAGDYDESDKACASVPAEVPAEHAAAGGALQPRGEQLLPPSPRRRTPTLPSAPRSWRSCTTRPSSASQAVIEKYPGVSEGQPRPLQPRADALPQGRPGEGPEVLDDDPRRRPQRRPGAGAVPACRLPPPAGAAGEAGRRPGRRQDGGAAQERRRPARRLHRRPAQGSAGARRAAQARPCQQRLAACSPQPPEKAKSLAAARADLRAMLTQEFAKHELCRTALLERAKVHRRGRRRQRGDQRAAPLHERPAASRTRRSRRWRCCNWRPTCARQNKAAGGGRRPGQVPRAARGEAEQGPGSAGWVPCCGTTTASPCSEAGKLPEARAVFEDVIKMPPQPARGASRRPCGWASASRTRASRSSTRPEEARRQRARRPRRKRRGRSSPTRATRTCRDAVAYLEGAGRSS